MHLQVEKDQLRCVCDRCSRAASYCQLLVKVSDRKVDRITCFLLNDLVHWFTQAAGMGSIMFLALCLACSTMHCAIAQKLNWWCVELLIQGDIPRFHHVYIPSYCTRYPVPGFDNLFCRRDGNSAA